MISIIICSRIAAINAELSRNIAETVDCEYELIVIDNSENQYSIFEAYNIGIEKSKGAYLCFMHDDIFIHTEGWGDIIHRIFNEDLQIGLIGVAGAKVKTKMPSAWWDCPEDQKVINIVQHFPNSKKEKWFFGFEDDSNTDVVAIDGVFMAARKDDKIHFNENLMGFHNYDLNISFEYKKNGYKIMVTNEILVEHFSLGNINKAWVESTFKIHTLYKKNLPLKSPYCKIIKETEVANARKFISECLKYRENNMAVSVWVKLFWLQPVAIYHIQFWKNLIKNKLSFNNG